MRCKSTLHKNYTRWVSRRLCHDAINPQKKLEHRYKLCADALNFVALTTPLVDLIELMRRLRVPDLLIDLMTISHRSIFVLFECIERTYLAQDSRLGYRNALRTWVSASNLGSRLLLETFRRSQQLGLALESRGYVGGALNVLPATYRRPWPVWLLPLAIAGTLLLFYIWW